MRTRLFVACLMFGPLLAGCQFTRKPPYARDPDLLHYKPALSSSADVIAERTSRRKPTPPPKPVVKETTTETTQSPVNPPPTVAMTERKAASPYGAIKPAPDKAPGKIEMPVESKTTSAKPVNEPQKIEIAKETEPSPKIAPPPTKESTEPPIKDIPDNIETPPEAAQTPVWKPNRLAGSVSDRPVSDRPVGDRPVSDRPESDRPAKRVSEPYDIVIKPPASDSAAKKVTDAGPVITTPDEKAARPIRLPNPPSDVASTGALPRTVPGNYGHDEDYTWLQGVVEKSFRGTYSLRFCDPSYEDQYGGKVRLEDDPRLADFKHGDVIAVTGQVEPENPPGDTFQYPRFRLKAVVKVQAN